MFKSSNHKTIFLLFYSVLILLTIGCNNKSIVDEWANKLASSKNYIAVFTAGQSLEKEMLLCNEQNKDLINKYKLVDKNAIINSQRLTAQQKKDTLIKMGFCNSTKYIKAQEEVTESMKLLSIEFPDFSRLDKDLKKNIFAKASTIIRKRSK